MRRSTRRVVLPVPAPAVTIRFRSKVSTAIRRSRSSASAVEFSGAVIDAWDLFRAIGGGARSADHSRLARGSADGFFGKSLQPRSTDSDPPAADKTAPTEFHWQVARSFA